MSVKPDPAAFLRPRNQTGAECELGGPLSLRLASQSFRRNPCSGGGEGAASGKGNGPTCKICGPHPLPAPMGSLCPFTATHPPGGGSHHREDVVMAGGADKLLQPSLKVRRRDLPAAWPSWSAVSPPPFTCVTAPVSGWLGVPLFQGRHEETRG